MSVVAEQPRISSSYGLSVPRVDHLRFTVPNSENNSKEQLNSTQWLAEYKKSPGSIFKYYSVKNELDFLNQTKELTPEGQKFLINKNVETYLAEFVGKIPYKTIHYETDGDGFTFAGIHMTDSYKKAAELSKRNREYAEGVGFQLIEDELTNKQKKINPPTVAYWTSPPKDWNYGFCFIFKKNSDGRVIEYILRYPEKKGELTKSNDLLQVLDPYMHELNDADDFLLTPIFGHENTKSNKDLDMIMRSMGIDDRKIEQSHYFEEQIQQSLGSWIDEYSKRVIALSHKNKSDDDYIRQLEHAEILLLSIYQQAEEIKNLFPYQHSSPVLAQALKNPDNHFSQERFSTQIAVLEREKNLPQSAGGSCPTAGEPENVLDPARFISNDKIIKALKNGNSINGILNERTIVRCTCPECGHVVDAVIENGTISCPPKEKGGCGKSAPYEC